MSTPRYYQIHVQGHLNPSWSGWLGGMTINQEAGHITSLYGPVRDQAALFGILIKVRDMGLNLISVNCVETQSGGIKMVKSGSEGQNPALEDLEVLAGDWDMQLSNASFLPDPTATITGHVSFEWTENGAFLVLYMGDKPPGIPDAIWLISRDESVPNYTVLYYDARKVSRVYQMTFSDGVWKMWRNSPDFSQRYEGKLSNDGNTITASWEKYTDGETWEHDFDITYKR